jgi:hypothetical protein
LRGYLAYLCVPSSAICTYSKIKDSSSSWREGATRADTPPTSTGSFTSYAPPDMGVVWKAVPYIEKELKNYRTTKNPQNQKKSEGSGRQNDDEKATSGSLSRERVIAPPRSPRVPCAVFHTTRRIIPLGGLSPSMAPSGFGVWLCEEASYPLYLCIIGRAKLRAQGRGKALKVKPQDLH